jgi:hypothetical protein
MNKVEPIKNNFPIFCVKKRLMLVARARQFVAQNDPREQGVGCACVEPGKAVSLSGKCECNLREHVEEETGQLFYCGWNTL